MPTRIPDDVAKKIMINAGLKPFGDYVNYDTPWNSECTKCHELVSPTLHSIRSGQGGCAYCAGKKTNPAKATALMKSVGFEPLEEYPGSKIRWKCRHTYCGNIVYPQYNKVQQGLLNSSCKTCSKKYVDPDEAFEKMTQVGVIPQEPYPGKDKKWKCLCLQCNKIVDSRYSTVRDGGGGCQRCSLRKTAIGRRFSEKQVREIFKKVNLKPIEKYTNTDAPLKCKCTKCGNFPSPTFTAIRAGGGCRYCSEKLTSPDKAIKLAKKAGLEPLEKFISGQVPWRCRHIRCGQTVSPIFSTILKGNSGCIKCNAKKAAKKYRLPEATVNAIMLNANMKPLEPYVNANTKWKCKCLKCKKIITPTLGNVQNGSGCINCSLYGFKLSDTAYLYLMYHLELNSYKVGIGGSKTKTDRIETHKSFGWDLYKRKDFKTGKSAYEVEQELLLWLRTEVELGVYLLDEQMPQGGHTETIDASEIDLPTIWAKVEELSKVKR